MVRVLALLALRACDGLTMTKFLANSVGDPPYYWPGKNGDELRTGASANVAPSAMAAGPSWSFEEPDAGIVSGTPLIDENRSVYLSTRLGRVYKFDSNGNQIWRYQAKVKGNTVDTNLLPSVPAMADGMIFNALDDGRVFALDLVTGREVWNQQVAQAIAPDSFSMTAGYGLLLTPMRGPNNTFNNNDYIAALNLTDGSQLWTYKPQFPTYNLMAAMVNSSIVFEDSFGGLYRLGLDGNEIWRKSMPANSFFTTGGAMLGEDGVIYTSGNVLDGLTQRGLVTASRLEDGATIWQRRLDLPANSAPAVGRLGKVTGLVLGIGPNPSWPLPPGLEFPKPGVDAIDLKPERAVALDAATGDVLWDYALPVWHGSAAGDTSFPEHICLPDAFANAAIGGDGTAYVLGESGRAYAILDKNSDGVISEDAGEVSFFDTKNAFQASPAIAPGMLVIAPCNGLHVFLSDKIA